MPPENTVDGESVWYIDASMLDGKWTDYRATRFGIVVASDGGLLGYERGCPPSWCTTAAAAETWALAKAVHLTAFPPQIRTDCQSLLTIAGEGTQRALAADKPLARAWGLIATALDGDVASIIRNEKLVWLPAHLPMGAIGERKLSNGRRLTAMDWRANRLVDALAKQAAAMRQAPPAVLRLLKSARAAVRHSAALLGEVTHAANNHKTTATGPDGTQFLKIIRDAQPKESGLPRRAARPCSSPTESPVTVAPIRGSSSELSSLISEKRGMKRPLPSSRAKAAREAAKRRRAEEDVATRRRIEEIAAAMRPRDPDGLLRPTAEDRFRGVLERVRARGARNAADSSIQP